MVDSHDKTAGMKLEHSCMVHILTSKMQHALEAQKQAGRIRAERCSYFLACLLLRPMVCTYVEVYTYVEGCTYVEACT